MSDNIVYDVLHEK